MSVKCRQCGVMLSSKSSECRHVRHSCPMTRAPRKNASEKSIRIIEQERTNREMKERIARLESSIAHKDRICHRYSVLRTRLQKQDAASDDMGPTLVAFAVREIHRSGSQVCISSVCASLSTCSADLWDRIVLSSFLDRRQFFFRREGGGVCMVISGASVPREVWRALDDVIVSVCRHCIRMSVTFSRDARLREHFTHMIRRAAHGGLGEHIIAHMP